MIYAIAHLKNAIAYIVNKRHDGEYLLDSPFPTQENLTHLGTEDDRRRIERGELQCQTITDTWEFRNNINRMVLISNGRWGGRHSTYYSYTQN